MSKFAENSFAILAPGQGCHYAGMGEAVYEQSKLAQHIFYDASTSTGIDLAEVCFGSQTEKLEETVIAQPAIAVVSLANFLTMQERGIIPDVGLGHSLGELAILGAAGCLTMGQTFTLIKERAEITNAAAKERPGAMAVIKNMNLAEIKEELADLLNSKRLSIPNLNTSLQNVLSGDKHLIEQARVRIKKLEISDKLRQKPGVIRLAIQGAFHSEYHMEKAVEPFFEVASKMQFREPGFAVMLNNSRYLDELGTDNLARYLANQLVNGVDFVGGTTRLVDDGVKRFVDIGPKPILGPMIAEEHGEDIENLSLAEIIAEEDLW